MKPGWQTSEFWLTLLGNVLAFAVAFGIIPIADKDTIQGAMTQIVTGVFALITNGAVLWRYIESRRAVKTAALYAVADEHMTEIDRRTADAYAAIPDAARKEASGIGMPILTLILLAFQHRDDIAKLIEAIRNWRKP